MFLCVLSSYNSSRSIFRSFFITKFVPLSVHEIKDIKVGLKSAVMSHKEAYFQIMTSSLFFVSFKTVLRYMKIPVLTNFDILFYILMKFLKSFEISS